MREEELICGKLYKNVKHRGHTYQITGFGTMLSDAWYPAVICVDVQYPHLPIIYNRLHFKMSFVQCTEL